MDRSSVIGLTFGLLLILWSMGHSGLDGLKLFVHGPAAAVVLGGSAAAIMIHFPMSDVKNLGKVVLKVFLHKEPPQRQQIARLVEYAVLARKEGILALEAKVAEEHDPFFKKGLQLLIDGMPAETVREMLEIDMEVEKQRHAIGKRMLDQLGAFAPAFGMVETLIALVQMLSNLSDPSKIGAGMAGALVGTFYGAFAANMIFLPMGGKLDVRAKEEHRLRELIIEGLLAIQVGEKPQPLKEKLLGFLAPTDRSIAA
jgi:chemotaxis protein MotA